MTACLILLAIGDSSVAKKAVPAKIPSAPRAKAALAVRASTIPPAAITGTRPLTISTTYGTAENVPTALSGIVKLIKPPRNWFSSIDYRGGNLLFSH